MPPPGADETLARSRYLPRIGKDDLLRALGLSVVNPLSPPYLSKGEIS